MPEVSEARKELEQVIDEARRPLRASDIDEMFWREDAEMSAQAKRNRRMMATIAEIKAGEAAAESDRPVTREPIALFIATAVCMYFAGVFWMGSLIGSAMESQANSLAAFFALLGMAWALLSPPVFVLLGRSLTRRDK